MHCPPCFTLHPLRRAARVLALAVPLGITGLVAPLGLAQAAPPAQEYRIEAGSLATVVSTFAAQSGVLLSAPAQGLEGRRSPGLQGRYTPGEGFQQILQGSGLQAVRQADGSYRLESVAATGVTSLSDTTVTGFALGNALGETDGYLATHSNVATKTSKGLLETSQSVSVVTREQIDEQGAKTVQQAMRYTPGIFTGQIGASNRYDYVVMRGFADNSVDNVFLDGLKTMGDSGTFSSLQVDPYFLERIDVVKGPASVLYGRSLPGGLVALTSKKPLYQPYHQVQAMLGNLGQRGAGFDFGGPLDEEGRIAYRLVGLAQHSDTQFNHVEEERYALAPSLAIDLSDDTTLTLQAYLQKDPDGGYHSGVPAEGSLYRRNGRYISNHFFDGEPDHDKFERTQQMVGYQFEHRFNDVWSARQNFRYAKSRVELEQVYGYGYVGDSNLLNRYYSGGRENLHAYTLDNLVQADFDWAGSRHTLLAGLDYQRRWTHVDWPSGTADPLDAFEPSYGGQVTISPGTEYRRELAQTGVYLQDLIELDRWRFSLGLRQDWVEIGIEDRLAGTRSSARRGQASGRAGALYLFDNGLAPYLSYSTSFNPNAYNDAAGNPLEPTEGKQWELGLKYQPPGSTSFYTASLFHITQENVATKLPQEDFYSSVGEIRSRGLELEGHLQLAERLKLLGSYTFTDIEYTQALDGNQGNTPNQAPRHQASLWGEYELAGPLAGFSVGAGARYVGTSWADKANTRKVPAYTLVDAMLAYDFTRLGMPGLTARVNANNLMGKDYVASCYSLDFCYFGEERNVTATVSYSF